MIFLEKFGAGEGIRTLDPNLGKVPDGSTLGYPTVRYGANYYYKSIDCWDRVPPSVPHTYPATCFEVLGICFVEG